jgi:glycosyltransferase involved in cell wall biosynthesis
MLVYDSHELFVEAGAVAHLPGIAKSAIRFLEGAISRRADAVITVNQSIADRLRVMYGIHPIVVMNVPDVAAMPEGHRLRETLGLGDRQIVIYHGALSPGRGVEELVAAARLLAPEVAVVLIGDGELYGRLATQAERPELNKRLYVLPAVPLEDVLDWIHDADVGVVAFQAVDINNTLGTPNKLYDYLTCGIPAVVSDFPEMRRIVEVAGAGVTCDPRSPGSISEGIRALLAPDAMAREQRRDRIRAVAADRFSWAAESGRFTDAYQQLAARRNPIASGGLGGPPRAASGAK